MQELHKNILKRAAGLALAALLAGGATRTASATEWQARVGAQTPDLGNQILAFLPNEFWIYAGDSIRFSFLADEVHTVSFLKPGQTRPAAFSVVGINGNIFIGCPGTTPDGSSFDNSACVSSGPSTTGQTYTVTFPSANNFKLVCLVHSRMTGAIHVLQLSETLPHDQNFYDRQAHLQRAKLLSDANSLQGRGNDDGQRTSAHTVTAGVSSILANGGGSQTLAVMRFLGTTTVVHVGDTVEWTNLSTPVFHTITFGTEPANDMPPSQGVTVDSDGVRHAMVSSPNDNVNSGFLGAPNQETVGQPQGPLDFTRFRVTFTAPGTFNYICAIHDTVGMKATVIVQ
ncbi:MAG TPA: plastocyanin/azurin family copper-binding protein [Bryobacteraceae bacterium]|nr:plastocyanin/azurin family copper-binding protein [Bryobacteraceae bacterium]